MKMYDQREDERGYLVYINRYNGSSHFDNPNLSFIVNKINEKFYDYKYSTYRCACKLFALQKALRTCYIPYQMICTILERHQLCQIDSTPSIKPAQLTAVLHDIYFAAEQLGYFTDLVHNFDRESAVATLAGLFWAVYDPKRCNPLSVLECKQTFLLLCETQNFEQVVWEHFQLTSDHNLCVSRHRFESMLMNLAKLLSFLGESEHLKITHVQEIVSECFMHYPGLVGLTEYQFSCLWKFSSKFSYYSNVIALSKRLREAEFIVHNIQCIACRSTIQGLRFKCQKCRDLSLCIDCFSQGYTNKHHNVSHKMYEISTNIVSSNMFITLLLKLCNLFRLSSDHMNNTQKPSTLQNMEAKLIDTNAVELQEIDPPPAASSTVCGTLSRQDNSTSFASLRRTCNKNASVFSNMECQLLTPTHTQLITQKLAAVLDALQQDYNNYQLNVNALKVSGLGKEHVGYFDNHGTLLKDQLMLLKELHTKLCRGLPQGSSTPYRSTNTDNSKRISIREENFVNQSIHGAELNKSYVNEQFQKEVSISDVSSWFHLKPQSETKEKHVDTNESFITMKRNYSNSAAVDELNRCIDNLRIDTQMANFKDLLLKVREIVDDSYSDNTELARTTQQLEKALDRIIEEEERKRTSSV